MADFPIGIYCSTIFGLLFTIQTGYFIYKILKSRQTDYSEESYVTTIPMTKNEAMCCMGCLWASCVDKTTNRITLKIFIARYVFIICADFIITLAFYFTFLP